MMMGGDILNILMASTTTILVFLIVFYVLGIYPYYRLAQKADISWAWVAFIPYGSVFIMAKLVNWPLWWIFPVALLVLSWISVLGVILGIFFFIMAAIMLYRFRGGWGWVFINFIPGLGSLVFIIVLYVIALNDRYQYHERA